MGYENIISEEVSFFINCQVLAREFGTGEDR